MKILQVNCVYKKGSTGKIVYDIHTELLKRGIESVVCYGRGEKNEEEHVYKTCREFYSKFNNLCSRFTGIMYGGCYLSTRRLIGIIKKENPDIVHLHCINGYFVNIYRIVEWLKTEHVRTIITLHAEFMYTGGCGHSIDCTQWSSKNGCSYSMKCPRWRVETKSLFFDRTGTMWKRMRKAFEGFDDNLIVTSVSPWLMERAERSPIFEGKEHRVVLNGLDTSVFHVYETRELKKELGLKDEKIVFYATPSFDLNPRHIKGGYYVHELAKKMLNQNVKFIIAGAYSTDIKVSENILLLGRITDQTKLAKLYSMADVTLLTSKKETFSMVTAESLCCGTPIVGFKAGAPEEISIKEFSKFVEYGDLEFLKKELLDMVFRDKDKNLISKKAIEIYAKNIMCKKYIDLYGELCDE